MIVAKAAFRQRTRISMCSAAERLCNLRASSPSANTPSCCMEISRASPPSGRLRLAGAIIISRSSCLWCLSCPSRPSHPSRPARITSLQSGLRSHSPLNSAEKAAMAFSRPTHFANRDIRPCKENGAQSLVRACHHFSKSRPEQATTATTDSCL